MGANVMILGRAAHVRMGVYTCQAESKPEIAESHPSAGLGGWQSARTHV